MEWPPPRLHQPQAPDRGCLHEDRHSVPSCSGLPYSIDWMNKQNSEGRSLNLPKTLRRNSSGCFLPPRSRKNKWAPLTPKSSTAMSRTKIQSLRTTTQSAYRSASIVGFLHNLLPRWEGWVALSKPRQQYCHRGNPAGMNRISQVSFIILWGYSVVFFDGSTLISCDGLLSYFYLSMWRTTSITKVEAP